MIIESVISSWAGHKTMVGFPLLPKHLPTKKNYNQGKVSIKKTKWLKEVCWARVLETVPDTGRQIWKDAHWLS